MKKKILSMLLVGIMTLSLVACGNASESPSEETEEQNKTEDVVIEEEADTAEKTDASFKDDVLKIDMATIAITGYEILPPNTDFGEEKSSLVITYDFTNNSEDLLQPGVAWMACFTATQETETTVDSLDVGIMPLDEKYAEMNDVSYTDVKPGATVSAVISYQINDTTQPITLKATQGIAGKELGEKVYNLQ